MPVATLSMVVKMPVSRVLNDVKLTRLTNLDFFDPFGKGVFGHIGFHLPLLSDCLVAGALGSGLGATLDLLPLGFQVGEPHFEGRYLRIDLLHPGHSAFLIASLSYIRYILVRVNIVHTKKVRPWQNF